MKSHFILPDYLPEIAQSFKRDLPRVNGVPSWPLVMSTRHVVNQEGMTTTVDLDPDYTGCPEPKKTV